MTAADHVAAFEQARTRREVGIVKSILHAEDEHQGWADEAFAHLVAFAAHARTPWTIEQARVACYEAGLAPPPDHRAWGGVTLRALNRGVIRHAGWALATSSNNSPKSTYLAKLKPKRKSKRSTRAAVLASRRRRGG